jgi:hypothetical protein
MTSKEDDTGIKAPGEFKKETKWKTFKEGLIAYLNALKGKHNIPLAYIIRENKNPQANQAYQTEHHSLIAITPLIGVEYDEDNGRVFDILKSLLVNGPAWTWMRAYNNTRIGRQAWISLVTHFEGNAQSDRVKDMAYASIAAARYHGERKRFSFETYVTIHQDAYANLEQYGKHVSEEKRVKDLLMGIKDNSPAANAAKGTILATPALRTSFANAVAHLATTLQLNQSFQDSRNISGITTGTGRGGEGRGNNRGGGRGRGVRHGRGRNIYLGSYAPDAWRKLSSEDKKKVITGREQSAQAQSQASVQGSGGRGRGNGRNLSVVGTEDASAMTQPTMQLSSDVDQSILQGTLQGSAAVGEKRSMGDTAGSQMSRRHRINKVVTSVRLTKPLNISQVKYRQHQDHDSTVSGPCELDSHADTCVAGANCIVLEETAQIVNVSAFTDSDQTLENVPIVTAATAYDDEATGTTYIFIFGQALYLGDQMKNSLIFPNQLRANGLTVDDCPKHLAPRNQPSSHSLYAPMEDLTLPLKLKGVTSFFSTRTPTVQEVETCKWVYMSDEHNWDPHSEDYQEQENNYDALDNYHDQKDRNIMDVTTINRLSDPFTTVMRDISQAYDDQYIIASTNTSQWSINMTAEKIAKTWNIGLENAKKTLR